MGSRTLLLGSLALSSACGATAQIRGAVRDLAGPPVPHAAIYWWLPVDTTKYGPIHADSAGGFILTLPRRAGCYRLLVHQTGYSVVERTLRLPTERRALGAIVLEQSALPEAPWHLQQGCIRPDPLAPGPSEKDSLNVAP